MKFIWNLHKFHKEGYNLEEVEDGAIYGAPLNLIWISNEC